VTENKPSGSDPVGDLQRWLMRSGARGLSRELKGQFRRVTGGDTSRADVWETATTEPPAGEEAPECAWCPVCRAARRFRQSGPGLASQVAGAGDALFSIAQDTLSAFEATLATRPPGSGPRAPEGTGWPDQPERPAPPAPAPAPAGDPADDHPAG
jgi:hypothetical protein